MKKVHISILLMSILPAVSVFGGVRHFTYLYEAPTSAPGSIEDPGKNVRAKVRLNQSVFHQGWFKAARLQAELERRVSDCRATAQHKPKLPEVRPRGEGKSQDAGAVRMCELRVRESRRCSWRDQCFRARTSLVCLWRAGAPRPLCEAGTRRSDSGCRCLSAEGIPVPLQGGEDVKPSRHTEVEYCLREAPNGQGGNQSSPHSGTDTVRD